MAHDSSYDRYRRDLEKFFEEQELRQQQTKHALAEAELLRLMKERGIHVADVKRAQRAAVRFFRVSFHENEAKRRAESLVAQMLVMGLSGDDKTKDEDGDGGR